MRINGGVKQHGALVEIWSFECKEEEQKKIMTKSCVTNWQQQNLVEPTNW